MRQRFLPPSWPMIVVIWALLAPLAVQAGPLRPSGVPEGVQPGGDLATIEPKLNFDRVQPGQQVVVALVMEVQSGYHAQSNKPLDENLIPFQLTDLSARPGTAF